MINLLPQTSETLVVVHDWDVVLQRLSDITTPQLGDSRRSPKILAGWIKDDRFQLIVRQRRLNSFMPVVEGKIDPTSTGCLIFLKYRLMPMTRMYLVLWSAIALLSGIFMAVYYKNFLIAIGAAGIVTLIHAIAWANFKIHYKPLHEIIFKALA